jgi:hypothetical protein
MPSLGVGPFGFLTPIPSEAEMARHTWIRSEASPLRGRFRRDWIVPELNEANATQKGVIYRSAEGQLVYVSIDRIIPNVGPLDPTPADAETLWSVRRYPVVKGRTGRCSRDDYTVLAEAITAVSAEHEASMARFGPVPESEWPEDRKPPWKVVSISSLSSRSPRVPGGPPDVTPPRERSNGPGDPAHEPPTGDPMGRANPTSRETTDE